MRKIISFILIINLVMSCVCFGAVSTEVTKTKEVVIPFGVNSATQNTYVDVDLSKYNNYKIIEKSVDNGVISNAVLDNNILRLHFINGQYSSKPTVINKIDTINIDNAIKDNLGIVSKTAKGRVTSIVSASGDFSGASYSNNIININVSSNAKGVDGLDKNIIVDDEVVLSTDSNNRERNSSTKTINLPYGMINNSIPKTKLQSAKCGERILNNSDVSYEYTYGENATISANFKNGIPIANETTDTKSYPYYWIDRKADGTFKQYNPNSVYKTPRFNFSGEGTYLPTQSDPNCLTVSYENNKEWTDYSGFTIDNQKYVYIFDNKKGNPFSTNYNVLSTPTKTLSGQFYNTKKLTVEISQSNTIYKREGNLYSCGYLVEGTKGYGKIDSAYAYEEQDSFINPINNQKETYVSHMKFNFGPNKSTFGGYFTYPYTVICQYQHYKPTKLYSGSVTYYYESLENAPGYYYNGGVRITYEEKENVLDFPPSIPSNINYNSKDTKLVWKSSIDDYTPQNRLKYEIQIRKNIDQDYINVGITQNGQVYLSYLNFEDGNKFRVRAIDEHNQASDWGYMIQNYNALDANVYPEVVAAGENITINADVKSKDVLSVIAKNDSLNINQALDKTKSVLENSTELSIMLTGGYYFGFPSRQYILSQFIKGSSIKDSKTINYGIYNPSNDSVTTESSLKVPIRAIDGNSYRLNKKGSIVIPNDNFLNTPTQPIYLNDNWWAVNTKSVLSILDNNQEFDFIRCIQNPNESFNYFDGGWKLNMIKRISVNTFKKDVNGYYIYKDFNNITDIRSPVTLTWDTYTDSSNNEVTIFKLYSGTKYLGDIETNWAYIQNKNILCNYGFVKEFYRNVFSTLDQWHSKYTSTWVGMVYNVRQNMLELPFLGYKVQENNTLDQNNIDTYNNSPSTRNVYRILLTDYILDQSDISKYLELMKTSNVQIIDKETTFLDEVIPTVSFFQKQVQIPRTTKSGLYILNVTANFSDGTTKVQEVPIVVSTPINLSVEMPYKMQKEKIYKITATTSQYVQSVSANILNKDVNMQQIKNDGITKTWEYNLKIDNDKSYGIYDKLEGEFRQAKFVATLASDENEIIQKPFMVGIEPHIAGRDIIGRYQETVQISTSSTGYCSSVILKMPDKIINLTPLKDITSYDNIWTCEYTILKPEGQYDIQYIAKNYFNEVNIPAKLIVRNLEIQNIELGRLFYKDNNKNSQYITNLSISSSTDKTSEGFICGGEVLAIKVATYGHADYLKLDFIGDSSIKTCDDLTKKFEYYNPDLSKSSQYENIQQLEEKYKFPIISQSKYYNKDTQTTIFTYYYVIPYKTEQTLHSWYTLRELSNDAFNIDKSRLLERIKNPYKLRVVIGDHNGSVSKDISLDIFERYDTVKNRDLTPYLKNTSHQEVQKDIWEKE